MSIQKHKVCIVGMGEFSDFFIPLFKEHPDVCEVSIADIMMDRCVAAGKKHGVTRMFSSLEDFLLNGKDIDCVAIFTQRHLHGSMVVDCLKAGKHVFSAVPMATTEEEIEQIIDLVKETRLTYMTGETCYYFPCAIFCREAFQKGLLGEKFVYGEAQYYHDMATFYYAFAHSGGDQWKRVAGIPPMYYGTHSTSMIISATGEYVKRVSCMGYRDNHEDNVFGAGKNNWDNPFSNETALMEMSGGGIARINEFRRAGIPHKPSSYITCFYGDKGGYEGSVTQHVLIKGTAAGVDDTRIDYVSDRLNTNTYTKISKSPEFDINTYPISEPAHRGFAPIHDVERLPLAFRSCPDTVHYNSHPFLVDDFFRAVVSGKLPPNNAWDSARYMLPGIYAHESAMKGGMPLEVRDFGDAPADWERLTFEKKDYYEILK